jgi:hypothetical protein
MGAFSDNIHKMRKQRVIAICTIKAVISIGPAGNQARGTEIGQFFLNCAQSQPAHRRQLADITLPCRIGEKQSQDLCAHLGKKDVQDCWRSFHQVAQSRKLDWFIQSSLSAVFWNEFCAFQKEPWRKITRGQIGRPAMSA